MAKLAIIMQREDCSRLKATFRLTRNIECFSCAYFARWLLFLILGSVCFNAHAEHADTERAGRNCTRIEMGISFSIPPWVIQKNNSGIELDILKAALESEGYCVAPKYLSFALAYKLFDRGELDGVINAREGVAKGGFLSQPVVTFQNVAVSLRRKNYPEEIDMDYLKDKSVIAFQKANVLLGPEFTAMTEANPFYREVAKQSLQINLLFIREADFIVMDQSIFGYYWVQALEDDAMIKYRDRFKRPVRMHRLFPPSEYPFIFSKEKVRDDFDRGLKRIRDTGEYDRIFKRYAYLTELYNSVSGTFEEDAGNRP